MCHRVEGSTLALELEHSVASRCRLAVLRRFVAAVHVVRYAVGPQTWRQMSRWAMQTLSWFLEFTQITTFIFFTSKFTRAFNFDRISTTTAPKTSPWASFIEHGKREREMKYKNGPDEAEKLQCVWCWCCCFFHVFLVVSCETRDDIAHGKCEISCPTTSRAWVCLAVILVFLNTPKKKK